MTGSTESVDQLAAELLDLVNTLDRLLPGPAGAAAALTMRPGLEALRDRAIVLGDPAAFVVGVTTGYLPKIEQGDYLANPASRRHAG